MCVCVCVCVCVRVCAGSLLIYSLLLNDVDAKTYEYGMLRALGMPARTLIQLLTTKAVMFALPAVCCGLAIAWIAYIPVARAIGTSTHIHSIMQYCHHHLLSMHSILDCDDERAHRLTLHVGCIVLFL